MFTELIKRLIGRFGYDIRYSPTTVGECAGRYWILDIQRLLTAQSPLILDIGANEGQTAREFKARWPQASVHSFEPAPETFDRLAATAKSLKGVTANNVALGAKPGTAPLICHRHSVLNSILPPGRDYDTWETLGTCEVEVSTVDTYCAERGIERIDVLKTDTQGFDLEVLRGSREMFVGNRVHLVFAEITFTEMYDGQARYDQVFGILADHGFSIVSLYDLRYRDHRLEWCNALFVNSNWQSTHIG
ncbi:MAG TPA: FkbM family methyltransferase, partial [Pirellulaceae bacterium]|nr:FkbM family methyltransferase [Pirellulaceae bacterium]